MNANFILFLKGMLMGICDLVPGISGGTVAFITGIYERLINAVKGFTPKLLTNFKEEHKKLDLKFLIVLFAGIIFSILLGSRIIEGLLLNHYAKTISFFIGLILASSFVIYDGIKEHSTLNYMYCFVGFLIGVGLIFLSPTEVSVSYWYLFVGGFLAIGAMFLPGISGSFILLIIGLYESVIGMLHDLAANWHDLSIFILGMIFGAFFISRIIAYLFEHDKNKTLYFLLGLVIGALGVPVMKVYEVGIINPWLFFVGAVLVLLVGKLSRS